MFTALPMEILPSYKVFSQGDVWKSRVALLLVDDGIFETDVLQSHNKCNLLWYWYFAIIYVGETHASTTK